MQFMKKDLLDMESLSAEEITMVLDTAANMKEISERPIKKVPTLRGKTVILFFYEPSTRTRTSFDIAAKRLSADSISISAGASSMTKGETLIDTAKNLEAMNPDVLVIRHSSAGAAHLLANRVDFSVINAGDGAHAHPSQALLDMMTVREKKGKIEGLRLAIIGDISHSRVALSNIHGLLKMGAKVTLCGPATLIPREIEKLGVDVCYHIDDVLQSVDVINVLRIQLERQEGGLFPSLREYHNYFGITRARLDKLSKPITIMHPGPINRGVEIASDVADSEHSLILNQVTNGVAIRMAVLYLLAGGENINA